MSYGPIPTFRSTWWTWRNNKKKDLIYDRRSLARGTKPNNYWTAASKWKTSYSSKDTTYQAKR